MPISVGSLITTANRALSGGQRKMPLPRVVIGTRGFQGMRQRATPQPWDPQYVYRAVNMVPSGGGYYRMRGRTNWAPVSGSTPAPQCQQVFHTATTLIDASILGGEIYTQSGGVWTKRISSANLTAASISLNTSGVVHAVPFSTVLIVSDGTNTPFQWDGTSGGGLTKLTNAPVFFGRPTVYYAKLFGIKNTDLLTIVWSEEGDATTGYEAGGATNFWQLRQTQQVGPLTALLGTNGALYYFRRNSVGAIRGAVTSDFTASGTHDDISPNIGSLVRRGTLYHGDAVWFADQTGRPYRYTPGGTLEPIWEHVADAFGPDAPNLDGVELTMTGNAPAYETIIQPWQDPPGVIFSYALDTSPITFGRTFLFDLSGQPLCELTWRDSLNGYAQVNPRLLGVGYDTTELRYVNRTYFLSGAGGTGVGALDEPRSNSYVTQDATVSSDAWSVTLGPLGTDTPVSQNIHWRQVKVWLDVGGQSTSSGSITPKIQLASATGLENLGSAIALSAVSVLGVQRQHTLAWGLKRRARHLQTKLTFDTNVGVRFGILGVEFEAYLEQLRSPKLVGS